jgi:hypothetical protein
MFWFELLRNVNLLIAMPQATAALCIQKFTKYLVNLKDIYKSLVERD